MTTGKTIALTIRIFLSKMMSLLFKMLSFLAAVTVCSHFGAQENKTCHCFHFLPIYFPWRDVTIAMIFVFRMLRFRESWGCCKGTWESDESPNSFHDHSAKDCFIVIVYVKLSDQTKPEVQVSWRSTMCLTHTCMSLFQFYSLMHN